MGAVIALLLVLSTLTACAGSTVTDVKNAMPAMAAMPQEDTAVTYVVNVAEYTDTICDEDGTELVMYSYQVPELQVLREDGSQVREAQSPTERAALATAETFNSRFSDWTEEERLAEIAGYAREDRAWRTESGGEWTEACSYTESLTCQVYQTEHLVSIAAVCDSYTGGAHPNQVLLGWRSTGSRIISRRRLWRPTVRRSATWWPRRSFVRRRPGRRRIVWSRRTFFGRITGRSPRIGETMPCPLMRPG